MYLNHDELMLLSRGGRVPRAERPRPGPIGPRPPGPGLGGVGRHGRRLAGRLRSVSWPARRRHQAPPPGRGELGAHAYLELEFTIEDER
jgi:hypothetical protein